MLAVAVPHRHVQRVVRRPRLPSPRRLGAIAALIVVLALASTTLSTISYLRVPGPTGEFAVGRADSLLIDAARREPASRGGGPRSVRLVTWYPAVAGTGTPAGYVPNFDRIRTGLEASGELPPVVVSALPLVGTAALSGAKPAEGGAYPVILLSPGNATNVAFYAGLAEDLASRGFVVIGVDHPYQVAAVDTGPGGVALYEGDAPIADPDAVIARIDERVADLSFVLGRVAADGGGVDALRGRLDLERIGVAGHSNGGIAAVELCNDARVDACVNMDGQQAGGPFSTRPDPAPPTKPFLFLTKETELHPAIAAVFEAAGRDTFRVVVPAASHGSFTDGSRYEPRLLPIDATADEVLTVERGFVGAFFDRYLRGTTEELFSSLAAPTDVFVEVYPLQGKPTLPVNDLP